MQAAYLEAKALQNKIGDADLLLPVDHLATRVYLEYLPSPKEIFVRNYDPRLHHMAISVKVGKYKGKENIDFVVDAFAENGKGFSLA